MVLVRSDIRLTRGDYANHKFSLTYIDCIESDCRSQDIRTEKISCSC